MFFSDDTDAGIDMEFTETGMSYTLMEGQYSFSENGDGELMLEQTNEVGDEVAYVVKKSGREYVLDMSEYLKAMGQQSGYAVKAKEKYTFISGKDGLAEGKPFRGKYYISPKKNNNTVLFRRNGTYEAAVGMEYTAADGKLKTGAATYPYEKKNDKIYLTLAGQTEGRDEILVLKRKV